MESTKTVSPVNRRILIIDDKASIHEDFRQILVDAEENLSLSAARSAVFGISDEQQSSEPESISFELDCVFDGQTGFQKASQMQTAGRPYAMAFVDLRLESEWDGIETIEHLWQICPNMQIVICTAYSDYSWNDILNRLGRTERLLILKKPFDTTEVRQMACSLTEKWQLLNDLETVVAQRTAQITETRDVAMFVIASLAESRDPETGEHLERIRSYCHILAEQLRADSEYSEWIDDKFISDLYRSSPLHDIGKVGIPDSILLKPGTLSDREFEIMKQHSIIGADALGKTITNVSNADFLQMAAEIAKYHHERFDGTGYPEGLKAKEIPLSARIVALADVYDALTSSRVYKPAFKPEIAYMMLIQERGKHFDPVIVDAFISRHQDFLQIRETTRAERTAPKITAAAY